MSACASDVSLDLTGRTVAMTGGTGVLGRILVTGSNPVTATHSSVRFFRRYLAFSFCVLWLVASRDARDPHVAE